MQYKPKDEARKVIPRWRILRGTPTPELLSSTNKNKIIPSYDKQEVLNANNNWIKHRDLLTASELISFGLVYGKTTATGDAAAFVIEQKTATTALRDLASSYLKKSPESQIAESTAEQLTAKNIYSNLATIKKALYNNPRNAILYVEAARMHASLGQTESAKQKLRSALAIAPTSRFVLRSATRFYIHNNDITEAQFILRDIPESDPWLMAANLSVTDLADGKQKQYKQAKRLMNSDISPTQLTELASSLATLELSNGNKSRAKKYFKLSAIGANENTVAQLRWAENSISLEFDKSLLRTELSFEARTKYAEANEDWEQAVSNCKQWLLDEPFAIRAAKIGSFLCAEYLTDFKQAQWFIDYGLQANPNDAGLLNDLAYCLAMTGKVNDAEEAYNKALLYVESEDKDSVLEATKGLIQFRQHLYEKGASLYESAINKAMELEQYDNAQRALIHWILEEINRGCILDASFLERVNGLFSDKKVYKPAAKIVFDKFLLPRMVSTKYKKQYINEKNALENINLDMFKK
ncbi:MAG: hypothetical protein COA85_11545 [Robiginitomaculum sp.]|nr:MAG: hypothetical protein COA85_11545 [Robiginitomaculum sp.]